MRDLVEFELPDDYLAFLRRYGYGLIGGGPELQVQAPDSEHISGTFSVEFFCDFWDWTDDQEARTALREGTTVAITFDGDIVCCVDNAEFGYLLLPRHSEVPVRFAGLLPIIRHLGVEEYFEPASTQVEKIGGWERPLGQQVVGDLRTSFLAEHTYDRIFGHPDQPKYVVQSIGGYVWFDLVYGSIDVGFQPQFEQEARKVVEFIEDLL
ncbi:MAG: hypothetical protein FWH11_07245 [Micrococcales bacterium]|nr:hypothetical protein [Micrococcales bacterium]